MQVFLAKYLHIDAHSDIRMPITVPVSASMSFYVMTNTYTYLLSQVHILLSQLQIHANTGTYMQINTVGIGYLHFSIEYLQVGISSLSLHYV